MQGRGEPGWVDELGDGQLAAGLSAGGLESDEVAEEPQRVALGLAAEIGAGGWRVGHDDPN